MMMSLEELLQWFYDQERNIMLFSFWDGGWELEFDYGQEWSERQLFRTLDEVKVWLLEKKKEIEKNEKS